MEFGVPHVKVRRWVAAVPVNRKGVRQLGQQELVLLPNNSDVCAITPKQSELFVYRTLPAKVYLRAKSELVYFGLNFGVWSELQIKTDSN